MEKFTLIADSHHGVFMAQLITREYHNAKGWDWSKMTDEEIESLKIGAEDTFYWEAVNTMEEEVTFSDESGKYYLVFNEDLWLVHESEIGNLEDWII